MLPLILDSSWASGGQLQFSSSDKGGSLDTTHWSTDEEGAAGLLPISGTEALPRIRSCSMLKGIITTTNCCFLKFRKYLVSEQGTVIGLSRRRELNYGRNCSSTAVDPESIL
ncbi:unnamed protein product [Gongylonema pulchrum]|uniref:Uncharacterized protein n=1 Tax=Gongylonema pulchrum TaxID=637853 RepID=A0A183EJ44_9BILA|nr:unnamed protein product [Gongylonema pulchrum]